MSSPKVIMKMEKAREGSGDILSANSREVISQVRHLFSEVDGQVEELKALTGVHCPPMCGICCEGLKVETTLIEMMPLAEELWRKNEADIWLDKLNSVGDMFSCVFFRKDPEVLDNGRCLVYGFRPLICRLFGFFTIRDKNGKYNYGSCIVMKKKYPDNYQRALKMVREGAHPSNVTDYSIRIISMRAGVDSKMLPINIAAKMAIEKIGFEAIKSGWDG